MDEKNVLTCYVILGLWQTECRESPLCNQVSYANKKHSHKLTCDSTANDHQPGNDGGEHCCLAVNILTSAESSSVTRHPGCCREKQHNVTSTREKGHFAALPTSSLSAEI